MSKFISNILLLSFKNRFLYIIIMSFINFQDHRQGEWLGGISPPKCFGIEIQVLADYNMMDDFVRVGP